MIRLDVKVKINMKGSAFDGKTGVVVAKADGRPGVWWVKLDGGVPSFPMMFLEKELEEVTE